VGNTEPEGGASEPVAHGAQVDVVAVTVSVLVPAQPVGHTVGQGAVAVMVAVVGQLGFTPGCVVVSIFRQAGTKQAPPEALGHGQPEGVTVVLAVKQPQGAGQVTMPVPGRVVKGLCASGVCG